MNNLLFRGINKFSKRDFILMQQPVGLSCAISCGSKKRFFVRDLENKEQQFKDAPGQHQGPLPHR